MYRILVVDEERNVLSVARLFLEKDGDIIADTATSPVSALAKLEVCSYDAIVSDYLMPEMDGLSFLREVRSRYGDIPFIIMTAHSREEVVIEALNNGATGYLQKGADVKEVFTELAHLIRNAIGKRNAEVALAESEVRYNDIVENAHDLIHSVRPDGSFILINRAWREILGYSVEESLEMSVFDVIAPEALDAYMEMFSALLRGDECVGFETVFLAKDGSRIAVRGNINCQMAGGIPVASRGIFHCVSCKEKKIAQAYAMFSSLQNLSLPIIITDPDGLILWTNSGAGSLFEEAPFSLPGMDVRHLFTDSACWHRISGALSYRGMWQGEVMMKTKEKNGSGMLSLCCAAGCGNGGVPGVISMAFPGCSLFEDPDLCGK